MARSAVTRWTAWSVVPCAAVVASAMVWQSTTAAFTDVAANAANTITVGSVALDTGADGTALVVAGPLAPGQTDVRCLDLVPTGSLDAEVRMFARDYVADNGIGSHLTIRVERGTGSTGTSCTSFVPSTTVFDGTMDAFATASTWETGRGSFLTAGSTTPRPHRVTVRLAPGAPDSTQGSRAALTLVWQARSR